MYMTGKAIQHFKHHRFAMKFCSILVGTYFSYYYNKVYSSRKSGNNADKLGTNAMVVLATCRPDAVHAHAHFATISGRTTVDWLVNEKWPPFLD